MNCVKPQEFNHAQLKAQLGGCQGLGVDTGIEDVFVITERPQGLFMESAQSEEH